MKTMVRRGHASTCMDGLYSAPVNGSVCDASDIIRISRKDLAYTDRIAKRELEAAGSLTS